MHTACLVFTVFCWFCCVGFFPHWLWMFTFTCHIDKRQIRSVFKSWDNWWKVHVMISRIAGAGGVSRSVCFAEMGRNLSQCEFNVSCLSSSCTTFCFLRSSNFTLTCAGRKLQHVQANIAPWEVGSEQSATHLSVQAQTFSKRWWLPQDEGLFHCVEGIIRNCQIW